MTRYKYPILFLITILLFFVVICGLKCYSNVRVKPNINRSEIDIIINFLLPMRQNSLSSKVTVSTEIPNTPVSYKIKWLNSTTMILSLEQKGNPRGQMLTFQINDAPTAIPLLKKSVSGQVRPSVDLRLLSEADLGKVPSGGPVPIIFNTPVDPKSIKEFVTLPIPGQLKPIQFSLASKRYTDYSQWQYIPDKPFQNNRSYTITLNPGLQSMGKSVMKKKQELTFTTAIQPRVVRTNPGKNANQVRLYPSIEIILNQEVSEASVNVIDLLKKTNIVGFTEIKKNKIIFQPSYALLPGRSYTVTVSLKSKDQEPLNNYKFSFSTVDMENKLWVDVNLGNKHTVRVYRGDKIIRHMLCSGGRPETPTPKGYFYTQDRGHSFWSARFGEGATYWVRLVGQVLVHSVPRDHNWKTKEEEHAKLGLPASHGCIRLDEQDAKWFFENIPRGTLVIIHE
ncbi:L,D-transpeptidase family protein [Desulfolucanica intricata]|uniref:L,D-transpeptidase family protein n=1 Tax=Desulfolucanica intricata TaxID=1285191 RepID=UPI0008317954|nr:Ig-like domain-containing protein [Desulfolucanica intricata]